jgi:DnaJ-class molecular chaperone
MDDHDHEWAEAECDVCDGTGRIHWNPSPINDPACAEDEPCPCCGETGVARETCERSAA